MRLNHYMVVTPEYTTEYQNEPPESGCDTVCIHAEDERTAIAMAMTTKSFKPWLRNARLGGFNPFTGVKAIDCKCEHGKCYCDECNQECEECEKQAEEQFEKEHNQ